MPSVLEKMMAVYQEQPEALTADHDDAMFYFDVCEAVEFGLYLFERINRFDVDIQLKMVGKQIPFEAGMAIQDDLTGLIRSWLSASERFIDLVACLERQGRSVENWGKLYDDIREARGILTPDDEFFTGPALIALRDKALEDHRNGLTEPMD